MTANEVIQAVKHGTKIELKPIDGKIIRRHKRKFFNVEVSGTDIHNREYNNIMRLVGKYNILSVEPNGYKVLAIVIKTNKT